LGIFYAFLQSKIQNLKSKICGLAALSSLRLCGEKEVRENLRNLRIPNPFCSL
jgi:hypothetical protein